MAFNKEPSQQQTPGELKITEYANRVTAGEPLDSILDGLPPGMRQVVEARVNAQGEDPTEKPAESQPDHALRLPPQYAGLPSEIVEDLWIIPVYVDPEKTQSELKKKEAVLNALRHKERAGAVSEENEALKWADDTARISEIREQIGIPTPEQGITSFEQLGAIESMSVEEFAVYLAAEAKKQGKELAGKTAYEALTARPECRELRISSAFGNSDALMEVFHKNGEAIRKFKEDTASKVTAVDGVEYVPGAWDHYKIQYEQREREETHKGYITINKDQILTEFTPDVRHEIVKKLRDGGYRGQVKFPVLGSRALLSYDNIVLHGNELADVDRGIEIVQNVLNEVRLNHEAPRRGVDAAGVDGKKTSYTDRIAQLVTQASKDPSIDLETEIKRLKEPEHARE